MKLHRYGKACRVGRHGRLVTETPGQVREEILARRRSKLLAGLAEGGLALNYQQGTITLALNLLVNDLDLLVDHFAGEAIDRNVHPVTRLAFHDKFS